MIKINLLPEAKPAKKKKGVSALGGAGQLNVILLAGGVVLGLLAVLIQWWVLNSETNRLNTEIAEKQREVARLESILREVKDFENKRDRLKKKVDLIQNLKENQKGPVRLMDEVSTALPDLLWFENMEYNSNSIRLTGKALNPPAVANFLENLKKVKSFDEPTLQEITATGSGSSLYTFRLDFIFKNLDRTQGEPVAKPQEGAPKPEGEPAPPAKSVQKPADIRTNAPVPGTLALVPGR
jgi:Tfp pilus assembly protein PilN